MEGLDENGMLVISFIPRITKAPRVPFLSFPAAMDGRVIMLVFQSQSSWYCCPSEEREESSEAPVATAIYVPLCLQLSIPQLFHLILEDRPLLLPFLKESPGMESAI